MGQVTKRPTNCSAGAIYQTRISSHPDQDVRNLIDLFINIKGIKKQFHLRQACQDFLKDVSDLRPVSFAKKYGAITNDKLQMDNRSTGKSMQNKSVTAH